MKIFFDTEFTDISPRLDDVALISIGLVDETGLKTFYAELADTYDENMCSWFVLEAVLPLLEGGKALMAVNELRCRLAEWIESFDEPVTFVSDSFMDWEWMNFLYPKFDASVRPGNLVGFRLFRPDVVRPGCAAKEAADAMTEYHRDQTQCPWHHALHDALGLQRAWQTAVLWGWKPEV